MSKNKLDRSVKQGFLGAAHNATLSFPPGFRDLALQEARQITETFRTPRKFDTEITATEAEIKIKNISFDNLVEITLRACAIWDVRVEILRKRCHGFPALASSLQNLSWENTIQAGSGITFKCEATASEIENARRIRETAETILTQKGYACAHSQEHPELEGPWVPIHISVVNNVLRVEISLAGNPLYMRGYRATTSSLAPLREDIAAACIKQTLNWALPTASITSIYAPFAGSGTLGFEAFFQLSLLPVSVFTRRYALEKLTGYREASLAWLKKKLLAECLPFSVHPNTVFLERSEPQHTELVGNTKRIADILKSNGIAYEPNSILGDVFDPTNHSWTNSAKHVFVAMNPPFGIRMGKGMQSVPAFYNRIGGHVRFIAEQLTPKQGSLCGFVLCPCKDSWSSFLKGIPTLEHKTTHFMLGGRDIRLCMFKTKTQPR